MSSRNPFGDTTQGADDDRNTTGGGTSGGDTSDGGSVGDDRNQTSDSGGRDDDDDDRNPLGDTSQGADDDRNTTGDPGSDDTTTEPTNPVGDTTQGADDDRNTTQDSGLPEGVTAAELGDRLIESGGSVDPDDVSDDPTNPVGDTTQGADDDRNTTGDPGTDDTTTEPTNPLGDTTQGASDDANQDIDPRGQSPQTGTDDATTEPSNPLGDTTQGASDDANQDIDPGGQSPQTGAAPTPDPSNPLGDTTQGASDDANQDIDPGGQSPQAGGDTAAQVGDDRNMTRGPGGGRTGAPLAGNADRIEVTETVGSPGDIDFRFADQSQFVDSDPQFRSDTRGREIAEQIARSGAQIGSAAGERVARGLAASRGGEQALEAFGQTGGGLPGAAGLLAADVADAGRFVSEPTRDAVEPGAQLGAEDILGVTGETLARNAELAAAAGDSAIEGTDRRLDIDFDRRAAGEGAAIRFTDDEDFRNQIAGELAFGAVSAAAATPASAGARAAAARAPISTRRAEFAAVDGETTTVRGVEVGTERTNSVLAGTVDRRPQLGTPEVDLDTVDFERQGEARGPAFEPVTRFEGSVVEASLRDRGATQAADRVSAVQDVVDAAADIDRASVSRSDLERTISDVERVAGDPGQIVDQLAESDATIFGSGAIRAQNPDFRQPGDVDAIVPRDRADQADRELSRSGDFDLKTPSDFAGLEEGERFGFGARSQEPIDVDDTDGVSVNPIGEELQRQAGASGFVRRGVVGDDEIDVGARPTPSGGPSPRSDVGDAAELAGDVLGERDSATQQFRGAFGDGPDPAPTGSTRGLRDFLGDTRAQATTPDTRGQVGDDRIGVTGSDTRSARDNATTTTRATQRETDNSDTPSVDSDNNEIADVTDSPSPTRRDRDGGGGSSPTPDAGGGGGGFAGGGGGGFAGGGTSPTPGGGDSGTSPTSTSPTPTSPTSPTTTPISPTQSITPTPTPPPTQDPPTTRRLELEDAELDDEGQRRVEEDAALFGSGILSGDTAARSLFGDNDS